MPIYEYECPKCKKTDTIFQRNYNELTLECSECKTKMKKIISHTTFHLKGGGWAEDGYHENKT
jgi:putative FmdB family regulatory protein